MSNSSKLLGAISLISGTTIGAGMLALPLSTGVAGFIPALVLFVVCWLLMLWSAFLFLEVNCALTGEVNLISMARATLGKLGSAGMWFFYLALFYALSAAYIAGSGPLFIESIAGLSGYHIAAEFGPFLILLLFGPIVYLGVFVADHVNRILMLGMVVAYVAMIGLLAPKASTEFLSHIDTSHMLLSFAVIFTAFGYHIVIPTLLNYFGRDIRLTKIAIGIGSFIPLLVYIVWEYLILGTIPPHGPNGIASLLNSGASLSTALQDISQNAWIVWMARLFAIFALVTSFLGVTLALFDFLRDGLKLGKTKRGRAIAVLVTFGPPLLFALTFKSGFMIAIEYAGAIVALVLGAFPVLMVWSLRYRIHVKSPYRAWGGKPALAFGLLLFCSVIVLVVAKNLGFIPADYSRYL